MPAYPTGNGQSSSLITASPAKGQKYLEPSLRLGGNPDSGVRLQDTNSMKFAANTFGGLAGPEIELFEKHLTGLEGEGVEIGCLDGFSTVHILDFSRLVLTSIDPFIPDSMESSLIGQFERYAENVQPYGERARLRRNYSWNVAPEWDRPLDFLFIDGDHNYEAVLRDYNDWTPKLKVGAILAVHDSRMSRPGGAGFHAGPSRMAAECVYACPDKWEIIGEAFSLTMARKRT